MKAALLSCALLCFGSFAWAMARFFTKPQGATPFARALSVCASLCLICQLATIAWSQPTLQFTLVALGFYGVSFALFWLAVRATRVQPLSFAGSSDAPQHLLRNGPYRWIRHPFYSSYLLAWLAAPIGTGQWWLLFAVALMGGFYWKAARQEEAKFAHSSIRDAYQKYSQSTGMFAPKIFKSS